MRSRASFFNTAFFRKDLIRCIPVVSIYFVFWILVLPARFLRETYSFNYFNEIVNVAGGYIGSIVNLFYAIAIALLLFSYLFQSRSANMIHAFPVTRDGLFLTHTVAGVLASIVPNLLVTLITILSIPGASVYSVFQWLFVITAQYLCFFGFAAFLAQLTGHIIALPILYFILHFSVVVQELCLREMLVNWLFGLERSSSLDLAFLSPVIYIFRNSQNYFGLNRILIYHLVLLIAGIILLALSWILYRHRKIECAGDVIAFRFLRPIALILFTIGCSIVLGILIALFVSSFDLDTLPPFSLALCMIVGAFFGYFGGQMALKKKLNVFKREWIGYGAFVIAILVLLAACHLDVFRFSRYVPDEDEISTAFMDFQRYIGDYETENPQAISAIRDIHKQITEKRLLVSPDHSGISVLFRYTLKNGKEVNRRYYLDLYKKNLTDSEQMFINNFDEVYTMTELRVLRYCPTVPLTRNNTDSIEINGSTQDAVITVYLPEDDLIDFYNNCLYLDIIDGTLNPDHFTDTAFVNSKFPEDAAEYDVHFFINSDDDRKMNYYSYRVTPLALRSYAYISDYIENNPNNVSIVGMMG